MARRLSAPREVELDLGDEVYVGIFACSHEADEMITAEFDNVRISVPAPDDFVPYRDFIGSNLEIMDVDTGVRTIVYRAKDSIQAPNWTPDGKALIYNRNGRLYRFDLATREPTEINTDFADENNNDHVLSFDGKMLGDQSSPRRREQFDRVHGAGRRRRAEGDHAHGAVVSAWLVAGRQAAGLYGRTRRQFDIYSIASDGSGTEQRLTTIRRSRRRPRVHAGRKPHILQLDPIAGLMQIWRMPPGGYEHEQVTDDEFNNWFPHISPDGKQIVFISYGQDVKPEDHPFYKQCYLRLMPYPARPSESDCVRLRRAGHDQCAKLVAR